MVKGFKMPDGSVEKYDFGSLDNKPDMDLYAEKTDLPTKVSDLQNDAGYLTTETDPTVPSWAKQASKPSYTAQEVGALPDTTKIPAKVSELQNDSGFLTAETDPTVPQWAKQATKPSYTAQEVGALPGNTYIPTKVSDLTDDSGHYTKPAGGIPASDLAEEYVKDVQINGGSIVADNVVNIPIANGNTIGVLKTSNVLGTSTNSNGQLYLWKSDSQQIKSGTDQYRPIVASNQHESAFYGLVKAAGDTTQSQSSNAVGEYTEEAKIAIQKMLGIYQAPWELIREDTFTNETEADHIITVDSNGQVFQLTDVVFFFETPKQETYSKKGAYGQVWFTLNGSDGTRVQTESGAWEQQANTSAHGLLAIGEQRDGMMFLSSTAQTTTTNSYSVRYRYMGFREPYQLLNGGVFPLNIFTNSDAYITKIVIPSVTGTGHYRLYGKRKWQ